MKSFNWVFGALVISVLLAPLPFGANRPWSWSLLALFIGITLIAWSVLTLFSKESETVRIRRLWPILILFGFVIVWAALQAGSIASQAWHHPFWKDTQDILGTEVISSISLNPYASENALMRLLSYAGIFWLSLQYCRSRERARQVFYLLTVVGLVYAVYGLIIYFGDFKMIFWYDKWGRRNDLASVFVNRNSYATYAGLTLLCAIGLLIKTVYPGAELGFGNRQKIRKMIENLTGRAWILIIAIVLIATALLLTHSRGGFLSAGVGVFVLLLAIGVTPTFKQRYAMAVAMLIVISIWSIFLLSGEVTESRLKRTSMATEMRPKIFSLTLNAVSDSPWLGTGYGTFEETFRMYRNESIHLYVAEAHNTYFENALELGLPAALALYLAIGGLAVICLNGVLQRRRDAVYACIGLASTALVATHSMMDFSLEIPAVAATYSMIMGSACAQSWSTKNPSQSKSRLNKNQA